MIKKIKGFFSNIYWNAQFWVGEYYWKFYYGVPKKKKKKLYESEYDFNKDTKKK